MDVARHLPDVGRSHFERADWDIGAKMGKDVGKLTRVGQRGDHLLDAIAKVSHSFFFVSLTQW